MDRRTSNALELVYPPISNQEGDWLYDEAKACHIVKDSKLYMIGQRKELFFHSVAFVEDSGNIVKKDVLEPSGKQIETVFVENASIIRLYLGYAEETASYVELNLNEFVPNSDDGDVFFEFGPKVFRVVVVTTYAKKMSSEIVAGSSTPKATEAETDRREVLVWTPDFLLFKIWRGEVVPTNSFDYRQFTVFRLHYVGISTENDSLRRLFGSGHQKRTKILSNEMPLRAGSRVTDELVIFFFRVREDVSVVTWDLEDFVNGSFDNLAELPEKKLTRDAEKAFVHVLNSSYNEVKFQSYPKSTDGLFDENITAYGFYIDEDITLETSQARFRGVHGGAEVMKTHATDPPDTIFIVGNEAKLVTAEELLETS